ncbi:MAG: hypothetical protein Q9170_003414 [Blastenia crenularia]
MAFSGYKIPAVVVLAAASASYLYLHRRPPPNTPAKLRRTIPSPAKTLIPRINQDQARTLAYPPDLLPGARDVETHYGSMRVYEWGPEHGEKVFFIHGDTTPGPMLAPIAEDLAKKGRRVMVIDLWGRGYSDTPLDTPHDSRLYAMQIFFALASSPLSWTGTSSNGFSIIAFSLGAGIAMSFIAHYPYLVNSLILLAPAGILRYLPNDYTLSSFRHSSWLPSSYLRRLVGRVLGVSRSNDDPLTRKVEHGRMAPEVPGHKVSSGQKTLDIPAIVQWQFDFHEGFCHSFVNTIVHGPIMHQQSDWMRVCGILNGDNRSGSEGHRPSPLRNGKILVIFGDSDDVVDGKHVAQDLTDMLGGSQHVEFRTVPGGHGFPVPSCKDVVKHICEFWNI